MKCWWKCWFSNWYDRWIHKFVKIIGEIQCNEAFSIRYSNTRCNVLWNLSPLCANVNCTNFNENHLKLCSSLKDLVNGNKKTCNFKWWFRKIVSMMNSLCSFRMKMPLNNVYANNIWITLTRSLKSKIKKIQNGRRDTHEQYLLLAK